MFNCLIISNNSYLYDALSSINFLSHQILFVNQDEDDANFDIIISEHSVDTKDVCNIVLDKRPIDIKLIINELVRFIEQHHKIINFNNMKLDKYTRTLLCDDSSIQLTEIECKILAGLMIASNNLLSRKYIKTQILGYHESTQTNTIENHIYHLRQKLNDICSDIGIDSNDNTYQLIMIS